jgi:hypothetical protein
MTSHSSFSAALGVAARSKAALIWQLTSAQNNHIYDSCCSEGPASFFTVNTQLKSRHTDAMQSRSCLVVNGGGKIGRLPGKWEKKTGTQAPVWHEARSVIYYVEQRSSSKTIVPAHGWATEQPL